MEPQPLTISFVGNTKIKQLIEQWAEESGRTQSAELRRIITQEAQRRRSEASGQQQAQTIAN